MIGNLAAAVDCCLEAGLMAEALLLAQVRAQLCRLHCMRCVFTCESHICVYVCTSPSSHTFTKLFSSIYYCSAVTTLYGNLHRVHSSRGEGKAIHSCSFFMPLSRIRWWTLWLSAIYPNGGRHSPCWARTERTRYSTVHLNVIQSYLEEWSPAQSIAERNIESSLYGSTTYFLWCCCDHLVLI